MIIIHTNCKKKDNEQKFSYNNKVRYIYEKKNRIKDIDLIMRNLYIQ